MSLWTIYTTIMYRKAAFTVKFTDGNWLIREGYQYLSAVQAHDFDQTKDKVTAYVSPRPIVNRSSMLDTMLLR